MASFMNALLTDLYELTMAAGYFETGKTEEVATFELAVRRLPPRRNFVLAAGIPQVVDYLLNLSFTAGEIEYLRELAQFRNAPPAFFDYLRQFRFTGDLFAIPEGTPLFAGEPVLTIRAPIIEAQIPETYVLAAATFPTLVATKASRIVEVAGGRAGGRFRRPPRALRRKRAFWGRVRPISAAASAPAIRETGFRYGIPVLGPPRIPGCSRSRRRSRGIPAASEVAGRSHTHLIDTYDTIEGARSAAALGQPLVGRAAG